MNLIKLWEADNEYIGIFHLRHYLNDFLFNGPGHIGYAISPEHHRHGYATRGVMLIIEIAKNIIPEDEIYLHVQKDNPASLKVQLKNGAYIHHEDDEGYYTRIPIS